MTLVLSQADIFSIKAASLTKKKDIYQKGQAGTCDGFLRLFPSSVTRRIASGQAPYEKGKKVSLAAFQDKGKVEDIFPL